jgi:hypothetical protein
VTKLTELIKLADDATPGPWHKEVGSGYDYGSSNYGVGWYSTELTPEGYAVESEAHAGSVQIYPAKALEMVS